MIIFGTAVRVAILLEGSQQDYPRRRLAEYLSNFAYHVLLFDILP